MELNDFKVKVNSEVESREVQELLFVLGCGWYSWGNTINYTEAPYIYKEGKCLCYGYNEEAFNTEKVKEITLQELRNLVKQKQQVVVEQQRDLVKYEERINTETFEVKSIPQDAVIKGLYWVKIPEGAEFGVKHENFFEFRKEDNYFSDDGKWYQGIWEKEDFIKLNQKIVWEHEPAPEEIVDTCCKTQDTVDSDFIEDHTNIIKESDMKLNDFKIKVNNEAESREVQELLFELGYDFYFGGKLYCNTHLSLVTANKEGLMANIELDGFEYKEITLQQLRDIVVLKRNKIEDATHVGRSGSEYYIGEKSYFWDGVKWEQRDFSNLGHLKPILEQQIEAKDTVDTNFIEDRTNIFNKLLQGVKFQYRYNDAGQWHNLTDKSLCHLIKPNVAIREKPQKITIDGIEMDKDTAIKYIEKHY